jgi:hypothetical protein
MPDLEWLHHSPNGGQRSALSGAQMKALGVSKGFPDLIVATDRPLAIEMKAKGGRIAPEQSAWLARLDATGWLTAVCWSSEEARLVICGHLGVDPNTVAELQ